MVKLFLAERLRALPKVSQLVSGKIDMQTHLPQVQGCSYHAIAASHTMATSIPKMA